MTIKEKELRDRIVQEGIRSVRRLRKIDEIHLLITGRDITGVNAI